MVTSLGQPRGHVFQLCESAEASSCEDSAGGPTQKVLEHTITCCMMEERMSPKNVPLLVHTSLCRWDKSWTHAFA